MASCKETAKLSILVWLLAKKQQNYQSLFGFLQRNSKIINLFLASCKETAKLWILVCLLAKKQQIINLCLASCKETAKLSILVWLLAKKQQICQFLFGFFLNKIINHCLVSCKETANLLTLVRNSKFINSCLSSAKAAKWKIQVWLLQKLHQNYQPLWTSWKKKQQQNYQSLFDFWKNSTIINPFLTSKKSKIINFCFNSCRKQEHYQPLFRVLQKNIKACCLLQNLKICFVMPLLCTGVPTDKFRLCPYVAKQAFSHAVGYNVFRYILLLFKLWINGEKDLTVVDNWYFWTISGHMNGMSITLSGLRFDIVYVWIKC